MNLLQYLRSTRADVDTDRMMSEFRYLGLNTNLGIQQTLTGKAESLENSFPGYVRGAYKSNGIIFACMLARLMLFTEARFMFQEMTEGRPGRLHNGRSSPYGSGLKLLDKPWNNATTGDLLARAIQDVDLGGNFYCTVRDDGQIRRLRPDWVMIAMGSQTNSRVTSDDIDAEVIGYLYFPGGHMDRKPDVLLANEVAHFAPIPDPEASYRGMSWLTPIRREIMADGAATTHKLKFFENGATVNMVVSFDPSQKKEQVEGWIKLFKERNEGLANAYKTLFLGGGAEPKPVGSELRQIEFKATQGAGETRIAAAAGVPVQIAGFSEGLQGSSLQTGVYSSARRRFSDGTVRPLWRNFAGSMETLIPAPSGSRLWYDDAHIPFLQEDMKDEADIQSVQAAAINSLITAGYEPTSVVEAVTAGDLTRLKHTGLFSVQLQKPGSQQPSTNGNGTPTEEQVQAVLAGLARKEGN